MPRQKSKSVARFNVSSLKVYASLESVCLSVATLSIHNRQVFHNYANIFHIQQRFIGYDYRTINVSTI